MPPDLNHTQPLPGHIDGIASSKRSLLLDALSRHVFNSLPAHLIRIDDMQLLSRTDLWEDLRDSIQGMSNTDLLALRSPREEVQSRLRYAIFSHRWGPHEPTHQQLSRGERWIPDSTDPISSPGLYKLARFCDMACAHSCVYAWSDTCCIDKSSSAELEEAIRAMYRWYKDAEVCIVHLAETNALADFEDEPWFTRGWTLQELLAPKRIVFYIKDWVPLSMDTVRRTKLINDKEDWRVLGAISKVTGIPAGDLRHFRPGCVRVAEKMRWASRRETTRVEDVAYALIGIFDITMPISYGEGHWAFHRLITCIAQNCSEPGFFAWAGDSSHYSLALPSSPASYGVPVLDVQTANGLRLTGSVFEEVGDRSYSITKLGMQAKMLLLPVDWIQYEDSGNYTLSFTEGTFLDTNPYPTLSQAYYKSFKPGRCVLGVVDYTRVGGDRGSLRVGEQYFCLLLKQAGKLGYIKARTDQVLVWQCVKGVTKDLEDVCLLNTLDSCDHDFII